MPTREHYLLSTQSLLDRLSGKEEFAICGWLDEEARQNSQVMISVVSVGTVQMQIQRMAPGPLMTKFERALQNTLRDLPPASILNVEPKHMKAWVDLMLHNGPLLRHRKRGSNETLELDDIDCLVVATALEEKLTLVERAQPYHEELNGIGLQVETLGE